MIEYLAVLVPFIGAFLGADGGSEDGNKMIRRFGIAILLLICALLKTHNFWVITIMSVMGALSIGYGLPGAGDAGSALGRFWYHVLQYNNASYDSWYWGNIFVRGTIGIVIALSLISIPLIRHNWRTYIIAALCIILINAFLSWRNLGSYEFFNETLSWVETINWGLITAFAMVIIFL